jgi:hypothetical protein
MAQHENPHFVEFEKVLNRLRDDEKIDQAPPPSTKEESKSYIKKITNLFKKDIYDAD